VRIVDDVTTFVANPHIAESDDFGLSVRWSKALAGVFAQLTTGADFRRIDGYDQQEVLNTPGQLNARILGAGVQTSVGAFVQASLRPSEWSEILAGVRLDRFSNSNGRIVTNDAAVAYDDRSFTIASPRVAGRAQITSNLGLRGAWFGGFRAPTLAELYRSFESPTFRGLSSPDLQEERLQGGDGGIEFRYERLAGQVNGFYNRLEDFVGSAEVGFVDGKFTVRATNVAAVRSRGLEAMATVRVSDFVTVDGSYTFTDATVVEGELEGNDVEGAPRHAYSLVGTYLAPRTTITVKARFVDDSFQDISNEAPQDAHFIVDLLTAQRVHRHIEIFVAGENVFDDQYVADGFGPTLGAPRQFSVGLRVSF
jgi:outer membrane receptor protein involved in Fe transport